MDNEDRAAPADVTPGTQPQADPQVSDPGRRQDAHETPEQDDSKLRTRGGDQLQPDGDPATEPAGKGDGESEKPKRKSRYQQRVEQLTDTIKGLQRQVSHFEAQARKPGQPRRLDPMDFGSDAEYQRALIAQTAQESTREFHKSQAKAAAEQAAVVEQEIWDARAGDYKQAVPDFEQVAYSSGVTYSQYGLDMVRQHDAGPQLAYYLGKNTAEALRISQLPPLQTAFALGALAERLKGPPARRVSSTPEPVPTVRGKSAATGFRPDSDDMDAYHAWRDKLPQ